MTILFLEDWAKHPRAIIDYTTKNESYKHLASVYREMGIQNHAFPLALHNPDLQGVDPFDPNLDQITIGKIVIECQENFWYFVREVARVPAQAGAPAEWAQANRANISVWWSFFNHIFYTLIQPRQTGKSISVDWLSTWLLNIGYHSTNMNLLTKDDALRRKNVQRIKDIMDELPYYLQLKTFDDVNNGEEISVKLLGNSYTTHVPQASPKRALNMGRGFTTPFVQVDEPPFQANIGLALPAMLAAMGAATERAEKVGAPYGVICTTTAGKKDDRDGKWFYQKIVCTSAPWTDHFLDAQNREDLEEMVRKNSPEGKLQIIGDFDHRQLGKTDAWLKKRIEEALQDGDDAERDYLNVWTSGNERSPFKPHITTAISEGKRAALHEEIFPERYILRWHLEPDEVEWRMQNSSFILGADTSEAIGRDEICICLIDVRTGETVAAGNFNETNLITFSVWLAKFLVKYKKVTLIPERRSTGQAIVDNLLLILPKYGEDPFRRIFNRIVHERDESMTAQERFNEIRTPMTRRTEDFYTQRKQFFGFPTAGSGEYSRGGLYGSTLTIATQRMGDMCRDPILVDQLLGLVNKNGRIDHEDGSHDDMVIAWLLAQWLMSKGKHLHHYGLETYDVMANVGRREPETPEQQLQAFEQQQLHNEMERLFEELSNEEDEHVALRLEQKLRNLDRNRIVEDADMFSFDELIRSARESKRRRIRSNALQEDTSEYESYVQRAAPPKYSDAYYNPYGQHHYGAYQSVYC